MIEFLFKTGLRVSEAINVRLKDIKPMGDVARIRLIGKGSKERFARPSRELIARIRDHFQGTEYLFEHGGRRYTREHVSTSIHRIGMAILGRAISAHSLRHSVATHLYKETHNLVAVQRFLGHTSSTTTAQFYVHDSFDDGQVLALTDLPVV
jgi:integrase/recombinase XerD